MQEDTTEMLALRPSSLAVAQAIFYWNFELEARWCFDPLLEVILRQFTSVYIVLDQQQLNLLAGLSCDMSKLDSSASLVSRPTDHVGDSPYVKVVEPDELDLARSGQLTRYARIAQFVVNVQGVCFAARISGQRRKPTELVHLLHSDLW